MSAEELLKPRFEVIAGYPFSPYEIGLVLNAEISKGYEKYPHLFKPLHWSVYREEKDMPKYIKGESVCYKVKKWNMKSWPYPTWSANSIKDYSLHYIPCSKQEYLEYIKTQTKL